MSKSRYFATEIYEESVDKFYIEKLQETQLEIAISPMHNKDTYTEYDYHKYIKNNGKEPQWKVGDIKKTHRHILICYPNTTTSKTIQPIIEDIKGVGLIQVNSKKGYYEYLTHKNEKNKYHYNEEEIIKLNGFELDNEKTTNANKEIIKREIIHIINANNINEYSDIYDYLDNNGLYEMCEILSKSTIFFNTYLKSKHFKNYCKDTKNILQLEQNSVIY